MTAESGSKTRTRTAIIDATIRALNNNAQASMSEIATEANVGRTTLHRYFPERSDLMQAVADESIERLELATTKARLERGTAMEALQRLCFEYIAISEVLRMIFNGSEASTILWNKWMKESENFGGADKAFEVLVERGHREGSFNPAFSHEWISNVLWSLLYTSVSYIYDTKHSTHETLALITETIERAVQAPQV